MEPGDLYQRLLDALRSRGWYVHQGRPVSTVYPDVFEREIDLPMIPTAGRTPAQAIESYRLLLFRELAVGEHEGTDTHVASANAACDEVIAATQ